MDKNTNFFLLQYDCNSKEKISHSIYNDFVHNVNNVKYLKQSV